MPVRRAWWRSSAIHPVILGGVGLVTLHLVFRTWAITHGYFYTDDYVLLTDAVRSRFTLEYLLRPDNGHFMPGTRAIYFLVASAGGLSWTLAATVSLALQLMASLFALWSMLVLFGRRWAILWLYLVYATSAMSAQAFMWWISSVNQTAIAISFFAAIGSWVQYLRTGRLSWLLATAGAVIWGLLFFQKSLLVLPVLVFLMLAYFTGGSVLQRLHQAITRHWRAGLLLGSVSIGYAVYLSTQVVQPPSGTTSRWWSLFDLMALRTFATGITGGPSGWSAKPGGAWADPPTWQVALSWLVICAVVVTSMLLRRRSGRAWLLIAGYVGVLVALIGTSRAGVFGIGIAAAYRLQTDALYVAVFAVGLAFLPVAESMESSSPRSEPLVLSSEQMIPWARIALALVAIGGVINWITWVDLWERSNTSKTYVAQLRADLDRIGAQDFADRPVPTSILNVLTGSSNRLSTVAPLIAPEARFPDQSAKLAVVTNEGDVRHAMIAPATRSAPGPDGECGWSVRQRGRLIPLTSDAPSDTSWLRIGYLASHSTAISIDIDGVPVETRVSSGLNSLYLRTNTSFDKVRIHGLEEGMTVCVGVVEVGSVMPGAPL
jgi:hypothetical protein